MKAGSARLWGLRGPEVTAVDPTDARNPGHGMNPLAVVAVACVVALSGCTSSASISGQPAASPASSAATGHPVLPPTQVPTGKPAAGVLRPAALGPTAALVPADVPMPDPALTPGGTQSTDPAAVCTPGWASAHRDVSTATKDQVAAAYGLSSRYGYEIDHLIPLELGGANTTANLWPEPYNSPDGAIQKDGLEDWLHQQVCDHGLALVTAQRQIAHNWYLTWLGAGRPMPSWFGYSDSPPYDTSGSTTSASTAPSTGRTTSAWCTASAAPANDGYPGDYDVTVRSNQPYTKATASDAGDSWSHETDGAGAADIRLWHQSPGETIRVAVGSAACTTTA